VRLESFENTLPRRDNRIPVAFSTRPTIPLPLPIVLYENSSQQRSHLAEQTKWESSGSSLLLVIWRLCAKAQLSIYDQCHSFPFGPETIPLWGAAWHSLNTFLYTKFEQRPGSMLADILSVECRIVSGELLCRCQDWVQVSMDRDQRDEIIPQNVFTFPCKHVGGLGY